MKQTLINMFNTNESSDLLLDEVDTDNPLDDDELNGDGDEDLKDDTAGWEKEDSE